MVDYQPLTATGGNLIGLCSKCGGLMYRRVSLERLSIAAGNLDVRFRQGLERINESDNLSVNCDFETGT